VPTPSVAFHVYLDTQGGDVLLAVERR
jgi:hypothetical protein